MESIVRALNGIRALEQSSLKTTAVHAVHPTAKIAVTLCYIICVVSCGRYDVGGTLLFALYPFFMMIASETSAEALGRRLLVALPFAAIACFANIIIENTPMFYMGSIPVSWGAASFIVVMIKAALTVSAALLLISTTKLTDIAGALGDMRFPPIIITQLLLIYRYLDMLMAEAVNMSRAYHMRAPGQKGIKMKHMGSFLGSLMLRTISRGERIYSAMRLRGFTGALRPKSGRQLKSADIVYMLALCGAVVAVRVISPANYIGGMFV